MENILIELLVPADLTEHAILTTAEDRFSALEIHLDRKYLPVEMEPSAEDNKRVKKDEKVVILRGQVDAENRKKLEQRSDVLHVWSDSSVEPFK